MKKSYVEINLKLYLEMVTKAKNHLQYRNSGSFYTNLFNAISHADGGNSKMLLNSLPEHYLAYERARNESMNDIEFIQDMGKRYNISLKIK